MSAVVATPLVALALGWIDLVLIGTAAIVIWQHRANIRRLLAGEEPKVGSKA